MKKNLKLSKYARTNIYSYGMIAVAFIAVTVAQSLGLINNFLGGLLVPVCVYVVMALSLNLVVGVSGELSLGHAGFMSVGAFSGIVAVAAVRDSIGSDPAKLLIAIVVGGIFAGIVGFLVGIPVLRLRGDYLAIVTLAFGEIIKNIINYIYVGVDAKGIHICTGGSENLHMQNGRIVLLGPQGAMGVQKIATFGAGVILIVITLFVVINLIHSRSGRAIIAIRDNRIAAESVGISVTKYKLTAFVISAVLAGMAGALYAMNYSSIAAKKFDFNTSILILVFVVLGGMGNIPGTIVATVVLYMVPEMLRGFADYRMLIYAIVLIVVMLAKNSDKVKYLKDTVLEKVFKKVRNEEVASDV